MFNEDNEILHARANNQSTEESGCAPRDHVAMTAPVLAPLSTVVHVPRTIYMLMQTSQHISHINISVVINSRFICNLTVVATWHQSR